MRTLLRFLVGLILLPLDLIRLTLDAWRFAFNPTLLWMPDGGRKIRCP